MKLFKKILPLVLSIAMLASFTLIGYAAEPEENPPTEKELLVTMLENADFTYSLEPDLAAEYISDILIDMNFSNLDDLNNYLGILGYEDTTLSDLQASMASDPNMAQGLLSQDELQWAMELLINGTVSEETHENHYLRQEFVQQLFSYYLQYRDILTSELEIFCSDPVDFNLLLAKIFGFYVNYHFIYYNNHVAMLGMLSTPANVQIPETANVQVLNLDPNWNTAFQYENVITAGSLSAKQRAVTNRSDVVNIDFNSIGTQNMDYILQLVDNGATLVIQNQTKVQDSQAIAVQLGIEETEITLEPNAGNTVPMGYCVTSTILGYQIEPVFASVLQAVEEADSFNLPQELDNLKNSGALYIDPVELYSAQENNLNEPQIQLAEKDTAGILNYPSNFYHSKSGFGYLYGKGNKAVWGEANGYTRYALIKMTSYVTSKGYVNGKRYNAVDTAFVATSLGGKYIKSYETFSAVRNAYMAEALNVKEESAVTYSTSYSVGSNGVTSSNSFAVTSNPAKQCIDTQELVSEVYWKCNPNSNRKDSSWKFEGSVLARASNGTRVEVNTGFSQLVVDGGKQYKAPCGIGMSIYFQNNSAA